MNPRVRFATALVSTVLIVLAMCQPLGAQVLAYGIAGPAGRTGFFGTSAAAVQAAGGAEVPVNRRAGVGGEVGVLANSSSVLLVFSANGVFHVRPARTSRVSPFLTGGYTRMTSGEGSFHAWNVGIGSDIWMKERLGIRVELRDQVRPDRRGTVQYWTVRAGVALR